MMHKNWINTVACLDSGAPAVKAPGLVERGYLHKTAAQDRIVSAPYISAIQRHRYFRQARLD